MSNTGRKKLPTLRESGSTEQLDIFQRDVRKVLRGIHELLVDIEERLNVLEAAEGSGGGAVTSVTGTLPITASPATGDVVVSVDLSDIQDSITDLQTQIDGKIDEVIAGTNLSGGGTSGSVTLNVVDSPTFAGDVTVNGGDLLLEALSGPATLTIKADAGDSSELYNTQLILNQDGGLSLGVFALTADNVNDLLIGVASQSATTDPSINFAIRTDATLPTVADALMTIEHTGDTTIRGDLTVESAGTTTDLVVTSTGRATLTIAGDSDNVTESDTAQLLLTQDGGTTFANVGIDSSNDLVIGMASTGANIYLAPKAAGSYASAFDAKLTVSSDGTTTVSGDLVVTGNATLGNSTSADTHTVNGATVLTSTKSSSAFASLQQGTGLTASNSAAVRAINTASYNTTSGALAAFGVYAPISASRSSGSNALTNIALFGSATGAQVNEALRTDAGDVNLNRTGGTTVIGGGVVDANVQLKASKGSSGAATANSNTVIQAENSTDAWITISGPSATRKGVLFANPSANGDGAIVYDHPSLQRGLQFNTANATQLQIANGGNTTLNVTGGTTTVKGATTIQSTLNATGAVDFDSTLNVDGATTMNSQLTVNSSVVATSGVFPGGASGPKLFANSGDPSGVVLAPQGSLYIRTDVAELWQNTNGGTTWVQL